MTGGRAGLLAAAALLGPVLYLLCTRQGTGAGGQHRREAGQLVWPDLDLTSLPLPADLQARVDRVKVEKASLQVDGVNTRVRVSAVRLCTNLFRRPARTQLAVWLAYSLLSFCSLQL